MRRAVLSICLLWFCSCSDRSGEEGASGIRSGGMGGSEAGFFVDEDFLARFCVTSGISYPITTDERTIAAVNPAPTDATVVKLHQAILADTLGIYARTFFGEIGLRKMVLCRRLSVDGIACQAFSDVEHGTLFVNLDAGLSDAFLKRTLHHEIFHFIDFAEDDRLDEDRSWSVLNPTAFAYGTGGGSMQNDPDAGRLDEALVGFVNRYSTSGLAEDKAEVYASLISDGPWMIRRASSDSILGRKIERIRTTLRHFGPLATGLLSRVQ